MKQKLPRSHRIEWDGQVIFTWCPETARRYRRRGARVLRHEPYSNRESGGRHETPVRQGDINNEDIDRPSPER